MYKTRMFHIPAQATFDSQKWGCVEIIPNPLIDQWIQDRTNNIDSSETAEWSADLINLQKGAPRFLQAEKAGHTALKGYMDHPSVFGWQAPKNMTVIGLRSCRIHYKITADKSLVWFSGTINSGAMWNSAVIQYRVFREWFPKLTNEEVYTDTGGNICPCCGSNNLEAGPVMCQPYDGDSFDSKVTCNNCGSKWRDLYSLTGYALEDEPGLVPEPTVLFNGYQEPAAPEPEKEINAGLFLGVMAHFYHSHGHLEGSNEKYHDHMNETQEIAETFEFMEEFARGMIVKHLGENAYTNCQYDNFYDFTDALFEEWLNHVNFPTEDPNAARKGLMDFKPEPVPRNS